jgi:glutamate racemase
MDHPNDLPERPRVDSNAARVGVFDSGVGGLSVLRALRQRLPDAPLLYLADSAYAPYGGRSIDDITERSAALVEHLLRQGAALIVVACNTATTAAISRLRARWPALPFVGVEPGIKPAVARSRNRRVAVMATAATIHSLRVKHLVELHGGDAHVHLQACPGLADAIEAGHLDGQELLSVLRPYCHSVRAANVDTVVLGCTHYPLVAPQIARLLGSDVTLLDTAHAVAERAAALWTRRTSAGATCLRLQTTGSPSTMLRLARQCLGFDGEIERVMVPGTGIEPVRPLSGSGGF